MKTIIKKLIQTCLFILCVTNMYAQHDGSIDPSFNPTDKWKNARYLNTALDESIDNNLLILKKI